MARTFTSMTKAELLELAAERKIAGRSRMSKDELVEALRGRGAKVAARRQPPPASSQKKKTEKAAAKKPKAAGRQKKAKAAAKKAAAKKPQAQRERSPHTAAERGTGGEVPGAFREVAREDPRAAEQAVHAAKFLVAAPDARLPEHVNELPFSYGSDRLVLMVRDPHSLFCYWDFSPTTYERIESDERPMLLHLRDVEERLEPLSYEVGRQAGNKYYVHLAQAGTHYRAELCLVSPDGTQETLMVSDEVATPPDRPARLQSSVKARFQVQGSWYLDSGRESDLLAGFAWAYAAAGASAREVEDLARQLKFGTHELAVARAGMTGSAAMALGRAGSGEAGAARAGQVPGSVWPGSQGGAGQDGG